MVWPVRERLDDPVALQHFGHIYHNGKRTARADVRPEMRCVGRQDNPAASRGHPHHLQAGRMTADKMHRDSRCDLRGPVMETHAPVMHSPHGRNDVFDLECMAQNPVAHASTRAIRHLGILDVKPSRGEKVDAAGMVKMHVRQHDVANSGGVPVEKDNEAQSS